MKAQPGLYIKKKYLTDMYQTKIRQTTFSGNPEYQHHQNVMGSFRD